MYQLVCADGYEYPGAEPTYITDIIPLASGLAAISSDQQLCLFDPLRLSQGPLKCIRTNHGNLTCASPYSPDDSVVATTGENGTVALWDLRLNPTKAQALQIQGDFPSLLSLACSKETSTLAAGTELANHQASVILWYFPSFPSLNVLESPSNARPGISAPPPTPGYNTLNSTATTSANSTSTLPTDTSS